MYFIVSSRNSFITQNASLESCNYFLCDKSHKLLLCAYTFHNLELLELIYTSVGSSSYHLLCYHFKHYDMFVDHFTKYTWFYPLRHKFDVTNVFELRKILTYLCHLIFRWWRMLGLLTPFSCMTFNLFTSCSNTRAYTLVPDIQPLHSPLHALNMFLLLKEGIVVGQ